MALVDLIGAKFEAFETRMEDRLHTLFVEFRLGRSLNPRRSQCGKSSDHMENLPEKEEQVTNSSLARVWEKSLRGVGLSYPQPTLLGKSARV
ncbi:hypothetical protein B296_00029921 [Ensete ventricosum]|uniref:Uncharacterized protein n=1 Tax=Ensete ventricosum TaxID=4639 RepID=A0A427AIQ3_ENSVE|nr:hypothetical protein B296_00029921 [Ensete ventricosum]